MRAAHVALARANAMVVVVVINKVKRGRGGYGYSYYYNRAYAAHDGGPQGSGKVPRPITSLPASMSARSNGGGRGIDLGVIDVDLHRDAKRG